MKELVEKIHQWGVDRKIIGNGKLETQWLKLLSEFGEMCDSLAKGKCPKDDIGDQFVVLVMIAGIYKEDMSALVDKLLPGIPGTFNDMVWISTISWHYSPYSDTLFGSIQSLEGIAKNHGLTLQECVEHAYNEIKDRKGYLNEHGVFIKEEV